MRTSVFERLERDGTRRTRGSAASPGAPGAGGKHRVVEHAEHRASVQPVDRQPYCRAPTAAHLAGLHADHGPQRRRPARSCRTRTERTAVGIPVEASPATEQRSNLGVASLGPARQTRWPATLSPQSTRMPFSAGAPSARHDRHRSTGASSRTSRTVPAFVGREVSRPADHRRALDNPPRRSGR